MNPVLPAPGFEPNFFSDYSVILDHPLADIFTVIGTSAGLERVTRLSGLCSGFELLDADAVVVDHGASLKDISCRTASSSGGEATRQLPRQFFIIHEAVPVIFGLLTTNVSLAGTLTWDKEASFALYESKTNSGIDITVWKLRVFEELEGNKTKVTETIQGKYLVMESTPPANDKNSAQKSESSSEKDLAAPPPHVVFEEYLHYAAIQRRFHPAHDANERKGNWLSKLSDHKGANVNVDVRNANDSSVIEDSEGANALRALRTASWASVFYLITTDILGPFNAPFAISQVGWVPGIYPRYLE
ncbi:hypothetical protein C0991_004625 [Blastosporella zonata]|nr:hypothetical protein C0991_004625 [Blastosporella zonata]